jgi:outer membrane protein assembly factor BamB
MAIDGTGELWHMRDRFHNRHAYLSTDITGEFRLAWKVDLVGSIVSQAISGDSGLFVNTMSRLYALDSNHGAQQWHFLPKQSQLNEEHSANKGTPAFIDNMIFLSDFNGFLYLIDADSGIEKWETDEYRSSDESPCVVNGKLFTRYRDKNADGNDKFGYLCLKPDGQTVWQFEAQGEVISIQAAVSNDTLVFSDRSGYLYAINIENGSLVWQLNLRSHLTLPDGLPGHLAYGFGPIIIVGSQILLNYGTPRILVSVALHDGSILWTHESERAISAPACANESFIYAWMTGSISAISLSDGNLKWRRDIGNEFGDITARSGLAIGNHYIVPFNSSKRVASFHLDDGSPVWNFKSEGGFSGEPIFSLGRLFLGNSLGQFYCFEPN